MSHLRPIDRWFIDEVLPHERRFLSVAQRLVRDGEQANDLVQEAFARLLGMNGWAAIANPRDYVLRSLRNIAIERVRRSKIVKFQRIADIEGFDVKDDAPDPFEIVAGKNLGEHIESALAEMPERCRTVLLRRRFDEQPARDVAKQLGISVSTMEKRLARALYLLSKALSPADRHGSEDADMNAPVDRDDAASG